MKAEVQNPSRCEGLPTTGDEGKSERRQPTGPACATGSANGASAGQAKPTQSVPLSILSHNILFIVADLPPAERLRRFHEAVHRLRDVFVDAAWNCIRSQAGGGGPMETDKVLVEFLKTALQTFVAKYGDGAPADPTAA